MTNQSELKRIIDFIINHTLLGTNATLDWRKRDELTKQAITLITANYTPKQSVTSSTVKIPEPIVSDEPTMANSPQLDELTRDSIPLKVIQQERATITKGGVL